MIKIVKKLWQSATHLDDPAHARRIIGLDWFKSEHHPRRRHHHQHHWFPNKKQIFFTIFYFILTTSCQEWRRGQCDAMKDVHVCVWCSGGDRILAIQHPKQMNQEIDVLLLWLVPHYTAAAVKHIIRSSDHNDSTPLTNDKICRQFPAVMGAVFPYHIACLLFIHTRHENGSHTYHLRHHQYFAPTVYHSHYLQLWFMTNNRPTDPTQRGSAIEHIYRTHVITIIKNIWVHFLIYQTMGVEARRGKAAHSANSTIESTRVVCWLTISSPL